TGSARWSAPSPRRCCTTPCSFDATASRWIMAQSGPDGPIVSLERERERTIELLSQHFAHDNLSLDELERRMEQVYRASSLPALRDLTRDLPTDTSEAEARRAVA